MAFGGAVAAVSFRRPPHQPENPREDGERHDDRCDEDRDERRLVAGEHPTAAQFAQRARIMTRFVIFRGVAVVASWVVLRRGRGDEGEGTRAQRGALRRSALA